MSLIEVKVPDIGDFKDVDIIELMVNPGDTVKIDQSLIAVESDKASMEIPSSHAGVVKELKVKVGDKVSEGSVILTLEAADAGASPSAPAASPEPVAGVQEIPQKVAAPVPDAPIPTPVSPAVVAPAPAVASAPAPAPVAPAPAPAPAAAPAAAAPVPAPAPAAGHEQHEGGLSHASPSVRKLARELGIDLAKVTGSGPKSRILHEDIHNFVKAVMAGAFTPAPAAAPAAAPKGGGAGLDLLPWPSLDFSKFGPTELQPLTRIMKISGPNLHRNWVMIPHVTQYDQADVTELEEFRVANNAALAKAAGKSGTPVKLTMLAFVIKACVTALKKYPTFNASLDASGENFILKQYYNIGFAADTPHGLVVPVIKDADKKGIVDIAREMGELSAQAREGKLKGADMQGASFTITSLGGIGGTYFTPIINAPEVAILGLSKTSMQPVWDGKQFVPRLMLPLSLSYDHRAIDGAAGTRFTAYIAEVLGDMRKSLL